MKGPANEALYLFVNNNIIPNSCLVSYVYETYSDPDGFLYINYTTENTFG